MASTFQLRAIKANLEQMGNQVLLVEGIDDWHALMHLIDETTGSRPPFELGHCDNDDGVLDVLSAVTEASRRYQITLGAVLDADKGDSQLSVDTGIQTRIRSLQGRLGRFYEIPSEFPAEGLILRPSDEADQDRLPVLGVWLMPDNERDGIFEDLLRAAMAPESETYISNVIDKAKQDGMASFRAVERSKAIVKTHVAWQDPNKKNLGEAIRAHFANLSPASQPFVRWLNHLFRRNEPA